MKFFCMIAVILLIDFTEGSPGIWTNPISNRINDLLSEKADELKKFVRPELPQKEENNNSLELNEGNVNEVLEQLITLMERMSAQDKTAESNGILKSNDIDLGLASRGVLINVTTRLNTLVKLGINFVFSKTYTAIGRIVLYPLQIVLQVIINKILPCGSNCKSISDF